MKAENRRDANAPPETNIDLPPVDRGPQAWRFVIGSWLLEGILWGFVLTFGVFQAHYTKHELFRSNESQIPVIGSMATGISHAGFAVTSTIGLRYPHYQIHMVWLGAGICALATFLASFAQTVGQLIFLQGALYGVGWVTTYVPMLLLMNEWWIARRGLIYGIVYGASGVGGLILPYLLESLLQHFGFRTTLRISALLMCAICLPGLLLLRQYPQPHRTPTTPSTTRQQSSQPGTLTALRTACQNRIFLIFALGTLLQGSAFFIPRFFLPQFAHALSLSNSQGASLLAIWSVAQVAGQPALGALADRVPIFIPATVSSLGAGVAALTLWGPAKGFWRLAVFAAVYGGVAAGYPVVWGQTTAALGRSKEEMMMMFSVFSLGRGLGNELQGPVSAALLGVGAGSGKMDGSVDVDVDVGKFGLGRYGGNVWFTGVAMLVSSLTCVSWFWRWELKRYDGYREVKGTTDDDDEIEEEEEEAREMSPLERSGSGSCDEMDGRQKIDVR